MSAPKPGIKALDQPGTGVGTVSPKPPISTSTFAAPAEGSE
jgi:hypothetical protein